MASTLTELSDEELVQRVAVGREGSAMEVLAGRHLRVLLSLAIHLTGNRALAEDALQETWMELWQRAGKFDPARGPARAWIFRIAVKKSLNLGRGQRRMEAKARQKGRSGLGVVEDGPCAGRGLEESERVVALRGLVARLPDLERRLVALYYGAGLTQDEIALELRMPQRTISRRLTMTVARLRAGLGGVGSAGAVWDPDVLREALLTCASTRPGPRLGSPFDGAFERFEGQVRGGPARTSIGRGAKGSRTVPLLVCGLLLLTGSLWVCGAGGGLVGQEGSPVSSGVAGGVGQGAVSDTGLVPVGPGRFRREWNFETPGQSDDFRTVKGTLRQSRGGGRGDGGYLILGDRAVVRIPVSDAHLPLRVNSSFFADPSTKVPAAAGIMWSEAQFVGAFMKFFQSSEYAGFRSRWHRVEYVFSKECVSFSREGAGLSAVFIPDAVRGELLLFNPLSVACAVDDLVVEQIPSEEVPERSEFTRALGGLVGQMRRDEEWMQVKDLSFKAMAAPVFFGVSLARPTLPGSGPDLYPSVELRPSWAALNK